MIISTKAELIKRKDVATRSLEHMNPVASKPPIWETNVNYTLLRVCTWQFLACCSSQTGFAGLFIQVRLETSDISKRILSNILMTSLCPQFLH